MHELFPSEWSQARPFTHPRHIEEHQHILRYMARQVCVLLEYPLLPARPARPIHLERPDGTGWFHRVFLSQPALLRQERPLIIVGFFGQKREDADGSIANQFDDVLIGEIGEHPGLFSYSSMALENDNYANLVVFGDEAALTHWSTSKAHAYAVRQLTPRHYYTVTIVNGRLPHGIRHHHALTLTRAKYYDYQCQPHWQAVREIAVYDSE